jgi:hypothetical protein
MAKVSIRPAVKPPILLQNQNRIPHLKMCRINREAEAEIRRRTGNQMKKSGLAGANTIGG